MTPAVKLATICAATILGLGALAMGAVWGAAAVVDLRQDAGVGV